MSLRIFKRLGEDVSVGESLHEPGGHGSGGPWTPASVIVVILTIALAWALLTWLGVGSWLG